MSEPKRTGEDLRTDDHVHSRTAELELANARLREASEIAREAEHRFRTVSELTSDYAYCFRLTPDFSVVIEWITAASFERVTGYSVDEIGGRGGGLGLVHPEDTTIVHERLQALVAGRSDVSEFRIIRKDGEVRWIREHGYPERADDDATTTRVYGAAQDVTEQKRVAGQLAAALRQRENVMETVPDIIYSTDCNGRLTDWNRRLEVVSGADEAKIEGASAADFFVVEDRARVTAAIERAFVENYASVEAHMATVNGPRLYHYTGVPLRDEKGIVVGLTGVGRDVSELKDAEHRTAVLLEAARDISGTLDMDEILERTQNRAADLLPCDMVATFCWDPESAAFRVRSHFAVPPVLVPKVEALAFESSTPFDGQVARGQAVAIDDATQIPGLSGIIPSGALVAAPLRVQGRHLGALVALRSRHGPAFNSAEVKLCEGIAAQLALALEAAELYRKQQEEARISGALAQVGQALIAALDGPGLMGEVCKVTIDVLGCEASHTAFYVAKDKAYIPVASHGYSPEAWERMRLLGLPSAWFPRAYGDDGGAVMHLSVEDLPAVQRALADSFGLRSALLMPLRRGNELIGVHAACYFRAGRQFTRTDERIARGIAQLASLALEHVRAVEAMTEASNLKSEFVATMSHELRTPLNVILGYNEMLLDGAFGEMPAAQREVLANADRSARGLLALITDTLDLSRLEAGRLTLDCAYVSVPDLICQVESEARESGAKAGVQICCNVPHDLPRLYTDAGKLRVVLKNLVTNALKFTDSGYVRLVAVAVEGALEISVEDSGIGISQKALDYIFEPFRQADGSSTRQHDGVGLGLYIVRRLLQALGGSVEVASQVGVGSTFRVSLPLRTGDLLGA